MKLLSSIKHRIWAVLKTTVLVVLGAYLAGHVTLHVAKGVLIASALWLGLYLINEEYDRYLEVDEPLDDNLIAESILVIFCIYVGALVLGPPSIIVAAMAMFELLYSYPRFRLKKYPWAGPILSGFIGPTLRFGLGVILSFSASTNFVLIVSVYLMLLVVHLPGAIKSRVFRRVRDKSLGYFTLSSRFIRRLRPLQFLTPIGVVALGILLAQTECLRFFPAGTMAAGLLLAVFLTTATWTMNDIHDHGGPEGAERAITILHEMWRLRFHTKRLGVTFVFALLLAGLSILSCPAVLVAALTGAFLTFDRAVGYHY